MGDDAPPQQQALLLRLRFDAPQTNQRSRRSEQPPRIRRRLQDGLQGRLDGRLVPGTGAGYEVKPSIKPPKKCCLQAEYGVPLASQYSDCQVYGGESRE
jgi:hypothetical protein